MARRKNDRPLIVHVVDQAVLLDRRIAEKNKELKKLKKQLIAEARKHPDWLTVIEDGGKSIEFLGHDGYAARVTFPKPTLKSSIDGEGHTYEKVSEAGGAHFMPLFRPLRKWAPVDDFRNRAKERLGKAAAKLIRLCTVKSSPRVSFETKPAEDLAQ